MNHACVKVQFTENNYQVYPTLIKIMFGVRKYLTCLYSQIMEQEKQTISPTKLNSVYWTVKQLAKIANQVLLSWLKTV